MTVLSDEFEFLETDAKRVGRTKPLPEVARFTVATERHGELSGLEFGSGTPRLAFMHGAGLNAHTFDPTILALNVAAVSLDLPGHGRSSWRSDANYRPEVIAPDVWPVIRARSVTPRILIGQSLGGLTALALAGAHAEGIQHVIVIDITPGVEPEDGGSTIREFIAGRRTFDRIDEMIDRAIEFGIGFDREALRRGITLNTRTTDDGQLEWSHHLAHLMTLDDGDELLTDKRGYSDLWASAEHFAHQGGSLTLIRGSHGMVSDAQLDEWRSRFGTGHDFTLDAGHNVQEHAPRELAECIATVVKL